MLPADVASLDEAEAAIELWEHYSGKTLDPSQRLDVQLMLAVRADGLWAAGVTGHEKPRQNGKGDAIEAVEFWGLSQRGERIAHTIHEAVLLATQAQQRMLALMEHPDLRRKKGKVWQGVGQQMIEFGDGIIWYRTRTGGGLRGIDEIDRVVIDEAQHAELEHLNAATPTQAVSANPQLNALGTGGLPNKSGWWWKLRKQAKRDTPASFGYLGYSAQTFEVSDRGHVTLGEVDPYDRQTWWDTNAALHAGRISEEFLERQLALLGPEGFAQEHLCVWAPPPLEGDAPGVIDLAEWDACARSESVAVSHRAWALAVSPDQAWASLAVAGRRDDGLLHVDVVDRRKGTSWIVDRVVEGWREFRLPLRVAKSDRNTLAAVLRERGVEVVEVPVPDVAQAVGLVRSLVTSQGLVHLGKGWLRVSAKVAQLSASGVWVAPNDVDVSPLQAVTLAAGGVPAVKSTPLAFFVT